MKRFAIVIVLFVWTIASVGASAQSYPSYDELYVNDFAGVLSAAERNSVRDELIRLENEYGVEMTVVTIPSYGAYNTGDRSFEAFATGLFNAWGVGDQTADDGVMILYSEGDRKVRIEVGSGYGQRLNRPTQIIIDEHMIPRFRDGNTGDGIIDGVTKMVETLIEGSGGDSGRSLLMSHPIAIVLAALGGTSVLGGGVVGYRRSVGRYRRRKCRQCGQRTMNLSENSQRDEFLTDGQRTEEKVGSVIYDVYLCPNDNNHIMKPRQKSFSSYRSCIKCGHKTAIIISRRREPATTRHSGFKETQTQCNHCLYMHVDRKEFPRKAHGSYYDDNDSSFFSSSGSDSSSGGGWDFGGGSSDGGGSSGDW